MGEKCKILLKVCNPIIFLSYIYLELLFVFFSSFIQVYFAFFLMLMILRCNLQIMANGCAYTINGDVYFSVDSFPEYGRLSGRKLEDNRAGERVEVDSRKKNPADFALWKVRSFLLLFFGVTILV